MQMPQAAKRVWAEETEEQQVVARRHNRRRPALAARAQVNTELRFKALMLFLLFAITATVTLIRSEESAMRGYELVQLRQEALRLERENKNIELAVTRIYK